MTIASAAGLLTVLFVLTTACSSSSSSSSSTADAADTTTNDVAAADSDAAVRDTGSDRNDRNDRNDALADSPVQDSAPDESAPDATVDTAACSDPNPNYGSVSENYLEWMDWMVDGSFENDEAQVELRRHSTSGQTARLQRTASSARTGSWGYEVSANAGQGGIFTVRFEIDKGEDTQQSIWVRTVGGSAELNLELFLITGAQEENQQGDAVTVGNDWTELTFSTPMNRGYDYALMAVEVDPETTVHFDDATADFAQWRLAEFAEGESREVGGIDVPLEPAAPLHFNVLIHIEDPQNLETDERYFQQQTAIFRELSRVLSEHGGFLTIQPEHDWVEAAEGGFDPGLLEELATDYDVQYSTHTHGPNCRDPEGVLRSNSACRPDWPTNLSDDDVLEYISGLKDLIEGASGRSVTDHNGNFDFEVGSRLSEIPMATWSGYKSHRDQRTYDQLIVNPWRPTDTDPLTDVDGFLTHDPSSEIVYLPGWGQAVSRQLERIPVRLPAMMSQFIAHTTESRVNSFYVVTHVGHYTPANRGDSYIDFNLRTGAVTFSEEFERDLAYWDDMLTDVIDPLVEAGYVRWTPLADIGEMYREWESACQELE
jgi:hypothetical protein